MFYYNQYVRAQSLDEAYELYQKKPNFVLGGMLWLKMKNKTLGTAIDLCDLGLDQIDEDENEFRIGAYATLRQIETHEALNAYTHGAIAESVRHIVGVQFRNVATVGGSIWGRFGFSDVMTIFRALGAKVQLHKAGIMDLDEFAALPRTTRDVLVSVIVPKNAKGSWKEVFGERADEYFHAWHVARYINYVAKAERNLSASPIHQCCLKRSSDESHSRPL